MFLKQHKERLKRCRIIENSKSKLRQKVEAFLLHKLDWVLTQKTEEFFDNLDKLTIHKRKRDISDFFDAHVEELIVNSQAEEEKGNF